MPEKESKQTPKSKNKIIMIIAGLVILVFVALIVKMFVSPPKAEVTPDCATSSSKSVTINYDGNNFSPSCITVNSGTEVTWNNTSDNNLEVGVDPHPIHSGDKAVTGGDFVFDVKAKSKNSEVIEKVGTYGYHDHLNSSATGTLKVQ